MSLRADFDPKYFRRFLYIAIGCVLGALWFLYDGLVKYPAELERAKVYWTPIEDSDEYKNMLGKDWIKVVKENDWPAEAPRKPSKMETAIDQQFFFFWLCVVITLPCLYKWFSARGTWVESDGKNVSSSWGTSFAFENVQSIDKTKWEKKGIAKITYAADGAQKVFVFDDFKYHRETMSKILSSIEDGLKDDQIVGADRETVIAERKAEQKRLAEERLESERQRVREQEEAEKQES